MRGTTLFLLSLAVSLVAAACPLNCDICSANDQCTRCISGYQLLTDYSCKQMNSLQGCALYTFVGRCGQCLSGFNLYSGFCYPPIANCEQYGPGNTCAQCRTNFSAFAERCLQSNYTTCMQPGTVLYLGMCLRVPLINCQEFASGVCKTCLPEYTLLNGLCFRLGEVRQPACLSPNLDGSCNQCAPALYLQNGKCLNATPSNCARNTGAYCTQCQQGYVNNNGACLRPPRPEDPNCNVVDLVTLECTGCNFQYRLNSTGWCVRQSSYCQTSDSDGKCTTCVGQLALKNGSCVYADVNCLVADYDNLICTKCKQGYVVSADQLTCTLADACASRDGNGRCLTCIEGYQVIDGSCFVLGINCIRLDASTKACISCTSGTSLVNSLCVFASNNCISYDPLSGACTECQQGFYRKDRSCNPYPIGCVRVDSTSKCSSCAYGLVLAGGACVSQIDSCLYYTASGCQFCKLGFFLSAGRCAAVPKLCSIVDQQGRCLLCKSPTTLYYGRCVYYQVFCLDYNADGNCSAVPRDFSLSRNLTVSHRFAGQWDAQGNMVMCQGGYVLISNNCVLKIDNCTSYDQMGACSSCADGFSLNETICINQAASCLVRQGTKCSLCLPEFALVNGTCYGRKNFGLTFDSVGYPTSYLVGYLFTSDFGVGLALGYNCINQNFSTGKCLECAKYYTLEGNNCIIKDVNCVSYNARGLCQVCARGFIFVLGVCRSTQFCSNISTNGLCTTCYQGFVLNSGVCFRDALNFCGAYNSDSVCIACYPGYALSPINTCVQVPRNCDKLSDQTGNCLLCISGYRLTNNQCQRLVPNCQSYLAAGCAACQMGYSLIGGECIQLPMLCRSLDATTLKCVQCLPGFVLVNNGEMCANDVPRCSRYNFDGSCKTCSAGYFLTNNRCLNVTNRCVRYNRENLCIQCAPPYALASGECRLLTPGCLQYTDGTCSRCNDGTYLSKQQQCTNNPPNCAAFNPDANACSACALGYSLKGGVCTSNNVNMDGCAQQVSPVECKQCFPGFTLTKESLCIASICVRFDMMMRCLECPPRFELLNGQCTSKNCVAFDNNTGLCISCASGYQLKGNSTTLVYCRTRNCQSFGTEEECTGCISGYSINNNRLCSISNCFTEVNFVCYSCNEGFALRNGLCQVDKCAQLSASGVCTSCVPNYILIEGLCIRDPKCSLFLPNDGACRQCIDGYSLSSNGTCSLSNCDQVAPNGVCLRCVSGFSLSSDGKCLSAFCLAFDSNNFCTRCTAGYSIVNRTCWLTGCSNLNSDGTCLRCLPRYDSVGGVCRPSNCTTLASNSSECQTCHLWYSLVEGLCRARNCLTFDDKKNCIVCSQGLSPIGGFCSFLNCKRFDATRCLECAPGYVFDGDKTCTARACQTYNTTTGGCLGCFAGFRVLNGLCIDTFCNTSTASGTCTSCLNGFVLDNSSYCWLPDPCRTLNSEGRCIRCIAGYSLDPGSGNCQLSNCLYFDNLNNCLQCMPSFLLKDRICSANFCKQFDSSGGCIECLAGYSLLSDGSCTVTNCQQYYGAECLRCIPSYKLQDGLCQFNPCAQYDINGICQQCFAGYNVRSGKCVSELCVSFDPNGVECWQCRGGYLLDNGQCVKIASNTQTVGCFSYNPISGLCTSCNIGFSLNGSYCQARNCARADRNQCFECLQGFALVDSNRRCLASNCASYDRTTYECAQCSTNYVLSMGQCIYQAPIECPLGQYALNRVCTFIPIRFCQKMDPNGTACIQCSSFTSLVAGNCFNLRNCQRYNENGCQVCSAGHYLSNAFCVASQVPFCNISDSTGRCLNCLSGYMLLNNNCYDVSQNCLQYDSSGCTICANGFAVQSGVCAKLGPNCASLYSNGSCQRCVSDYQLSGNGSCILTIANCMQYNNVACSLCEKYYTLSPDGKCNRMIEGCASMTSGGQCRACNPTYTLQLNNSATPPSNICVRNIDNCFQYGLQGCLSCRTGYKLVSGACASIVAYCTQYDPNNICTFCEMGYYLSMGLCIPLPINCLSVDSGYLCTACRSGFVLLRGACYQQNSLCLEYNQDNGSCLRCSSNAYRNSNSICVRLPDNCNEVNQTTGRCLTCVFGFDNSNGTCFKRIAGCRQYAQTVCLECLQGYNKSSTGDCIPDRSSCITFDEASRTCLICSDGYALTSGVCYKQIANCASYTLDSSCSLCLSGFILTGGICISNSCQIVDNGVCKRCASGYILTNGQCQPLCTKTNSFGRCIECAAGYSLINEIACIVTIDNCVNYDTNGQCKRCQPNYYMNSMMKCSALPPFCAVADPNGVCLECAKGASIVNGFCMMSLMPANCAKVDANGVCRTCLPQYTLLAGNCLKIPVGCASADTNGCNRCRQGLILANGLCLPEGLNISSVTTTTVTNTTSTITTNNGSTINSGLFSVTNCVNGQVLMQGRCVTPVSNCRNYIGSSCSVCNTGFSLIDGACLMPSYCTGLDIFGNCMSCASGYVLVGITCAKQILHCASYAGSQCSACVPSHYLSADSTCVMLPPNCMKVGAAGDCQQCNPLSNQIDGKCILKVNYCTRYGATGDCVGCMDGYFLYQGTCSQLPFNCQKLDDDLNCVNCSLSSVLVNGICSTPVPNCFLYDSRGSCQSCRFLYYLSRYGLCVPYPSNCVSVDQLGNCLSCCEGAYLQSGLCTSYTAPDTNCQRYDPSANRCIQCAADLMYCVSCNRCVRLDPNCYSFSVYDFTLCTSCNVGFYLISNQCTSQPPGILQQTSAGIQCRPTYYLNGTSCFKNLSLTMPMSNRPQVRVIVSSADTSLTPGIPRINSNIFWKPANSVVGEYIGYRAPTVVMIEAIQLQGNGQDEWVTSFTLQFTNSEGSALRCFNNCIPIVGNTDSTGVVTVNLDYPIIASEIRLLPQTWQKAPSCRFEFLID